MKTTIVLTKDDVYSLLRTFLLRREPALESSGTDVIITVNEGCILRDLTIEYEFSKKGEKQ